MHCLNYVHWETHGSTRWLCELLFAEMDSIRFLATLQRLKTPASKLDLSSFLVVESVRSGLFRLSAIIRIRLCGRLTTRSDFENLRRTRDSISRFSRQVLSTAKPLSWVAMATLAQKPECKNIQIFCTENGRTMRVERHCLRNIKCPRRPTRGVSLHTEIHFHGYILLGSHAQTPIHPPSVNPPSPPPHLLQCSETVIPIFPHQVHVHHIISIDASSRCHPGGAEGMQQESSEVVTDVQRRVHVQIPTVNEQS